MYVINQSSQFPIFQINEHIGFDADVKDEHGNITEIGDGQGIDGKVFAREFFETDFLNPQLITVYVNTMGGDVQQSLDMANAIARVRTKTKGAIVGFAYSCGGWIPLVCDVVEMVEHGSWMCHMPYNPKNENEKSDFLSSVLNIISTLISSKSGRNGKPKKTVDEIKEMMKSKTYYTAIQMYNEGLIDYITDASGKRIKFPADETIAYNIDTEYKEIKIAYKQKQLVFNKFIDNTSTTKIKTRDMKKVVNRMNAVKAGGVSFNLVEDSSEQDVINGIASMENRINNLSTDLDFANTVLNKQKEDLKAVNESKAEMEVRMSKLQSSKNELDSEMANLKSKIDNMEAENKELKVKIDEAANKEKEIILNAAKEKATLLIDENIQNGRIRASNKAELEKARTGWIEDAVENYEKTSRILNSMAVNVAMPVPYMHDDKQDNRPDDGDGSIKNMMAKNREERQNRQNNWQQRQDKIFHINNNTGTN